MLVITRLPTDRLLLRPFRAADLDGVHAFQSDPDVVRYLYWDLHTREQSRAWLDVRIAGVRLEKDGDSVAYAVERRSDGRMIGSINLWWRSVEHRQGEIGFVLSREAQGHGYAREAAAAVLDLVFRQLDLHRVCAHADARNAASIALMERLGMRQEAHLRENEVFKGEWGDEVVHAVLRRDWAAGARG